MTLEDFSQEQRAAVAQARRIVVKIGSRVLIQNSGRPDLRRIRELVRQVARLHARGLEVAVVSSGAIGTGMQALRMKTRPTHLPDLQMAAAVGQSRLMATYDKLFGAHGCRIGQVLLTHDDLKHRLRHLNARNTMMNLLRHRIVPIVNENDVVATDEIKFGDNDMLASLVTLLLDSDLLVLLTTVDGLREPTGHGRTRRVRFLQEITDDTLGLAHGKGSPLSTGGMSSKLQSAAMVVRSGLRVVIADGRRAGVLESVCRGDDEGTLIAPADGTALLTHRERWIAFFHKAKGHLVIDDGAREAIEKKGRSLLPIGVSGVEGDFEAGTVVDVRSADGALIARGLTDYSSADLRRIHGKKTAEIAAMLGALDYEDVIHRDNLVLLRN